MFVNIIVATYERVCAALALPLDPDHIMARPASNPFAPWSMLRALLTLQVKSRHAIAVLSALKSSLCVTTGGKGA